MTATEMKYMLTIAKKLDEDNASPVEVARVLKENDMKCMPGYSDSQVTSGFTRHNDFFTWYDYPQSAPKIEGEYAVQKGEELVVIREQRKAGNTIRGRCTLISPGSLLTWSWRKHEERQAPFPNVQLKSTQKDEAGRLCTDCAFGANGPTGCDVHGDGSNLYLE